MSWALLLKRTMPRCLATGSQAAKRIPCLCRLAVPETGPKHPVAVASSGFDQVQAFYAGLVLIRKTHLLRMTAAAVPLKSS